MERYEMAELLSKKANVSLEEAREALAENDWDLLDAMVALERRRNAEQAEQGTVRVDAGGASEGYSTLKPVKNASQRENVFTNGFAVLWHYIKRIFQLSLETNFVLIRREKPVLSVPVLVLAVLVACCFWVTVPILVIGLFVGFRYRFEGRKAADAANRVMDKVGDVVENIKESLDRDES